MVKPKIHALLAALLLASIAPTWADNSAQFKEAAAAYQAGDYSQAFRLFQQFADRGDAMAQNNLGMLYAEGLGVAQDYQQAKAWWQKVLAQPNTADNTQIKKYANYYLQELKKAGIR